MSEYFTVHMCAYAFETREQAAQFARKMHDAFEAMPEAEGYGLSSRVVEETDPDDDTPPIPSTIAVLAAALIVAASAVVLAVAGVW